MKFADALADAKKRTGTPCTVGVVLGELDPAEQDALNAAFRSSEIEGSTIARALQAMFESGDVSRKVAGNTVTRHRRGECRCD